MTILLIANHPCRLKTSPEQPRSCFADIRTWPKSMILFLLFCSNGATPCLNASAACATVGPSGKSSCAAAKAFERGTDTNAPGDPV